MSRVSHWLMGGAVGCSHWLMGAAACAVVLGGAAHARGDVALGRTTTLARVGSCGARSLLGRGPQLVLVGLTADQRLVRFGECNPARPRDLGPIAGLGGGDTALVGIDYRVQNGLLYGVGNAGGVYRFDTPGSTTASFVNQLTIPLDPAATAFAVDFNPAADRLRILSDTGQDLRHNVNDGGTTIADGALNYVEGTPPAPVGAIGVTGAAYTNNDLDPDTATSLFDIDGARDQVVLQSPPNAGVLFPTGKLTVDAEGPIGFDIHSTIRDGATIRNAGFAALRVGGEPALYRVDVLTGAAVRIGPLGAGVVDIAIPLGQ